MQLAGRKIAVLVESDYYEPEIFYYQHRFPEEGVELHLVSRLWGRPELTFLGHEYRAPLVCARDLAELDGDALAEYSAVIVPSGMVADRLRYTEDIGRLAPATDLMRRAFADPDLVKGVICHGAWLLSSIPEVVRGRPMVVHNNLVGDLRNMGGVYTDRDVVVDGDLITARTGAHCALLARTVIDTLASC